MFKIATLYCQTNTYIAMKTKLFLLAGCLIAAVTLNAQTIDVQATDAVDGINTMQAAAQTITVYVYVLDDGGDVRAVASFYPSISCDVRILGRIRWSSGGQALGAEDFAIRVPAGQTFGRSTQSVPYDPRYTYYLEGDEEGPATCNGYNIVYVWN